MPKSSVKVMLHYARLTNKFPMVYLQATLYQQKKIIEINAQTQSNYISEGMSDKELINLESNALV